MVVVTNLPDAPGAVLRGRAVDLREYELELSTVRRALQCPAETRVTIRSRPPGPVHNRVGVVREDRTYPIRAALAAAARARGHTAPQDETIARLREEIAAIDPSPPATADLRRDLAAARVDNTEYERLAALRGAVRALRDRGLDDDAALERFHAAVAEISDRETDRLVTEDALEASRERRRAARDRLERRLRLSDRVENLERAAREHLAAVIAPTFRRALTAVPGTCNPGPTPGTVAGDQTTAALAVCRIAPPGAPIVVATDRFPTPTAATACLDAPVLMI